MEVVVNLSSKVANVGGYQYQLLRGCCLCVRDGLNQWWLRGYFVTDDNQKLKFNRSYKKKSHESISMIYF